MSVDGFHRAFNDRLGVAAFVRPPRKGAPLLVLFRRSSTTAASVPKPRPGVGNVVQVGDRVENLVPQSGRDSPVDEEGLRLIPWTNADGERESVLDITVSRIEVLGSFSQQHMSAA